MNGGFGENAIEIDKKYPLQFFLLLFYLHILQYFLIIINVENRCAA